MKKENKETVTLYNVLFPIWFLIIFPVTWLIILPGNFIIDSLVVLITLRCLKIKDIKSYYKKSILKVWLLGFGADLIGTALLFLTQLMDGDWLYEYIVSPVSRNPWDNIYSLAYVMAAIIVTGIIIYFFNTKIAFKKTDLTKKHKHVIGLAMAVFTAPYLLLIPSELTYSPRGELHSFTSHILPSGMNVYVVSKNGKVSVYRQPVPFEMLGDFENALETADRIWNVDKKTQGREPDYIITAGKTYREHISKEVLVWQINDDIILKVDNKAYKVEKKRVNGFKEILESAAEEKYKPEFELEGVSPEGEYKILVFEDEKYKYYLMSEKESIYINFNKEYDMEIGKALELNIIRPEDLLEKSVDWIKEVK